MDHAERHAHWEDLAVPEEVKRAIRDYIEKLQEEIPVSRAIIFGSVAKGTFDDGSDIDLAVFSDRFEMMSRIDGIAYLLKKATEYPVDLEPLAFTNKEYDERLGIVDEIIRTGIEVENFR